LIKQGKTHPEAGILIVLIGISLLFENKAAVHSMLFWGYSVGRF